MSEKCPKCGNIRDAGERMVGPMWHNFDDGSESQYGWFCEACGYEWLLADNLAAEIERLEAVVELLPDHQQVLLSMAHIQDSIGTHEQWKKWRESGGGGDDQCGDLAHHQKCLIEYAQVMRTLEATRKAAEAAKEKGNE